MIEFKRNKKTGELEVWKDGKKQGEIVTMGDEIIEEEEDGKGYKRKSGK